MSSVDQKRAFNKLKHDLENYRELILFTNSVLKWDKTFYPGIIFGLVSIFFLFLWYLDMSVLTLISLGLFWLVLLDYICPIVSKFIFKPDNWTGAHENKFEEVCNEICATRMKLCSYCNFLFTTKEEKSTMFLITASVLLLSLAWIGSMLDNLFLSYMTILVLALYPGLHSHGFIGTVKQQFGSLIANKLQQLKEKANKTD